MKALTQLFNNALARVKELAVAGMAPGQTSTASHAKVWITGLLFGLGMAAHDAQATFLGTGLCKIYRQIVGSDVFITVFVIMAAGLVIAYKLAPQGSVLQKGVGIAAAAFVGLNIEPIAQAVFGVSLGC